MPVQSKVKTSKIINGRKIRDQILDWLKMEREKHNIKPGLAAILIGDDYSSKIYIKAKRKAAKKIGFYFEDHSLPQTCSEEKVIQLIKNLNKSSKIHGIIIQFPLPKKFDADKIVKSIDPKKDADGFHPENIKQFLKQDALNFNLDNSFKPKKFFSLPVTPIAVIYLLSHSNFSQKELGQKEIKIICKRSIFLTPLIYFFKKSHLDFEHILPDDPALSLKTKKADILIAAIGQPEFIKASMIKKGVVIIDVGINRKSKIKNQKSKIVGDVDFEDVYGKCSLITPVPGGVGPLSVAFLMLNVFFNVACHCEPQRSQP